MSVRLDVSSCVNSGHAVAMTITAPKGQMVIFAPSNEELFQYGWERQSCAVKAFMEQHTGGGRGV